MEIGNNEIQGESSHLKLIFNLDYQKFSYTIFNTENKCFELVKDILINNSDEFIQTVQNIMNNESALDKQYKNVLGSIDTETATFIPEPLFDTKNVNHYISLIGENKKHNTHKYSKQQFLNCYSLFTINTNLLSSLKTKFKTLNLKSTSSIFVDYTLSLNKKRTNQLFTQINDNNFHIIVLADGAFKFYNKFKFDNNNDFLYYFMNCLHILGLELDTLDAHILTNLDKDNILFSELREYLNITFVNRPENFLYGHDLMENSMHKNHNLFSQIICE